MRGLAVLAVLIVNINGMGGSSHSGRLRESLGWSGLDQIVWGVRQVLVTGTARCLLELLFGAGMLVLAAGLARDGDALSVARRLWVRYLLLFLIGLFHVFGLLWYGDFLHIYAIAALIVFPLRRLRAARLILVGSLYAVALAAAAITMPSGRSIGVVVDAASAAKPRSASYTASPDAAARAARRDSVAARHEDQERTATFVRWRDALLDDYVALFNWGWVIYGLGEAAATMLIGAGLFKLGVLQGQRSGRFYGMLLVIGYGIGLAIRFPPVWAGHVPGDPTPIEAALREIGRLSLTLGHVALISLGVRSVRGRRLLQPFVAAGRMALTLYFAQTVICLWLVFPPFGLALYGRMGWVGLIATAVTVDGVLLAAANLWMGRFRIGPLEWVWRSLAGGQWQALRHPRPLAAAT